MGFPVQRTAAGHIWERGRNSKQLGVGSRLPRIWKNPEGGRRSTSVLGTNEEGEASALLREELLGALLKDTTHA